MFLYCKTSVRWIILISTSTEALTFTDYRCLKGIKCKAEAGPHINSRKSVMKLDQQDSHSHLVPNPHVVPVKDAQYSWQRFMKTDFCWSLLESKGLHYRDKRPPVTARWANEWVSHGPTEGIMHRGLERICNSILSGCLTEIFITFYLYSFVFECVVLLGIFRWVLIWILLVSRENKWCSEQMDRYCMVGSSATVLFLLIRTLVHGRDSWKLIELSYLLFD